MIINRVPEEESGRAGDVELQDSEDNTNEYKTADELFELMAKNRTFDGDGDSALTTGDLVILYKNIDIDTNLIPNTNNETSKSPNQYVETVIYNDDQESVASDISEYISNEDLNDIFAINKERIDLMNNTGGSLCHKFGNVDMQKSDLTTEYDKHFLFNDPFLKDQLESFQVISKSKQSESTVLPASLLDYICCKRLENNYTFYMDNIIKYVQHTIEQLRRISNGDYLTEKAKEKWREVAGVHSEQAEGKKTVLTNSTSIRLPIEGRLSGHKSTWDDIVHSEMDLRSLSKILEKKIIVELPKILSGSYRLFSKRCKDNLVITCKKDKQSVEHDIKKESRVDVVLKLQRSDSGHVISNIDSIMILKSLPAFAAKTEQNSNDLLALKFDLANDLDQKLEPNNKIIELVESDKDVPQFNTTHCGVTSDRKSESENSADSSNSVSLIYNDGCEDDDDNRRAEANFNLVNSTDLHRTIHRLNMQSPVIEESDDNMKKKKSSTRVRIKSPYENMSHVIEEKKRKRLLEIREKRDKTKMAMSENCKITKHKYGRSGVMAQSSNSVTKLSITNKSFYNSIYGQTFDVNHKNSRKYRTDRKLNSVLGIDLEENEDDFCNDSSLTTPEKNSLKYINRSFYLDDADTEVNYLEMKQNENEDETNDVLTPSTLSTNDVVVNLKLLKQIIAPSATDLSLTDTSSCLKQTVSFEDNFSNTQTDEKRKKYLMSSRSTQVIVPTNTPKKEDRGNEENLIKSSSVECRRSIDKIYNLMQKNGTTDTAEADVGRGSSFQASDSGTSIKHQLTSSNPSCFSFDKSHIEIKTQKNSIKTQVHTASVIPKVIISSKLQNNKVSNKINNKDNKRLTPIKIQENPLKAISQLLHEFDSVQKTRNKLANDIKRNKKPENLTSEDKTSSRQYSIKRTTKQDQNIKDETMSTRLSFRERKRKGTAIEPLLIPQQQFQTEDNTGDKTNRKKIDDIIDEVKELRGEAVRGPSKRISRLNSLAQPKKAYVQAHHEEVQRKFGKRILPDKILRFPNTPVSIPERSLGSREKFSIRNKPRKGVEVLSTPISHYTTTATPSERLSRNRRSANNSPSPEANRQISPATVNRSSFKHANANVAEPPKEKMVAVETYVKNHYGRGHTLEPYNKHSAHKSRVPLIPTDIDLASLTSSRSTEESNVLGKKLHNIIDSMINTNVPILSSLTECQESLLDKEENDSSKDIMKYDNVISRSEYLVDIFEDKNIVTAVSNIPKEEKDEESISDDNINSNMAMPEMLQNDLPNNLLKLENALCHQISNGTFQKRLRIKNLTLTTKQSMEKIFILQSGDTGTRALKSLLSQNIKPESDAVAKLKTLPVLSNNCVDFGFTKFPMHIATVGYAFPHHYVRCASMTKVQSLDDDHTKLNALKIMTSENNLNSKFNSSIQHFQSAEKKSTQELIDLKQRHYIHSKENNHPCLVLCETLPTEQNNNKVLNDVARTHTFDSIEGKEIKNKNSNCIPNASNSTSLDILVGLLNEIKKITTYQPHLIKRESACTIDLESKELEIILNRAAVQESSVDNSINNGVSVTSFENLHQVETCASNYSLILSSNENYKYETKIDKNVTTSTSLCCQTLMVDKECPIIFKKEFVHSFTEVPSQFFPVSVSTNVSDSLIKIMHKSSRQSTYSFSDCQYIDSTLSNNIIAQPFNDVEKSLTNLSPSIFDIDYLKTQRQAAIEKSSGFIDFDPVMKMKRDILVTVYSILVLTVFAALSFPEIVY